MDIKVNDVTITLTDDQLKQIDAELKKRSQPAKPTPEEKLLKIIEGTVNHFDDQYPESVFLMKDGIVYFELDFENEYLWCRYDKVWSVFEKDDKMNYNDIQKLIKSLVEQRYKIGSLTPIALKDAAVQWWNNVIK